MGRLATAAAAAAVAAAACMPFSRDAGAQPTLTVVERRLLDDAAPVIADARQAGLPLHVIVQPQPNAGEPPLALAWRDGRCLLVLTMRGTAGAPLDPPDVDPTLPARHVRAMVAHELGHCWRHVRGAWHAVPQGHAPFAVRPVLDEVSRTRGRGDSARHPHARCIAADRREEAYADLFALAWTARHDRDGYADVHRWLSGERADPAHPGAEHDTIAWLAQARDPSVFEGPGDLPSRVERVWREMRIEEFGTDPRQPGSAAEGPSPVECGRCTRGPCD